MTSDEARRISLWLDCVIGLLTVVLAVAVVIAADQTQRLVEPPEPWPVYRRDVSRPERVWNFRPAYRRFQFDCQFALTVATLGAGLILAKDRKTWTRRGMSKPGTLAVVVAIVTGFLQIPILEPAQPFRMGGPTSSWYDIYKNLEFRLPGTILGSWIVVFACGLWSPCRNWRDGLGRSIGWGWLATIGLMLGYPLLFG